MRRFALSFFCVLLLAAATSVGAQVQESADARRFWINAGGFASGFQPDNAQNKVLGIGTKGNYLAGVGTYVDVHFSHWIQIEGEGRWLRFNEYHGEHEDTYLIGPKVPIHQFGRANLYGKVLIGVGKMTFPSNFGYGTFTALAYGGGVDYSLTRKLTFRPVDFEYQQWPVWIYNSQLHPYGVSVGMAYKVF